MERLNEVLRECVRLVVKHGHLVEVRSEYHYSIFLYSLNTDFFEIYYNEETEKIVWIVKADDHDLAQYLNQIEIDYKQLFH